MDMSKSTEDEVKEIGSITAVNPEKDSPQVEEQSGPQVSAAAASDKEVQGVEKKPISPNQDETMSDKPNLIPESEVVVHSDPQTSGASSGKEQQEEDGKNQDIKMSDKPNQTPEPEGTVLPDPQTTGASTGNEEEHGKNQYITMSDKPNQTPEPEVTVHPDPQTTGASTGKEEEHGKNQDITMSDKPNQTPEPEVTVHPDPQTTGASTGKEEEHGKNQDITMSDKPNQTPEPEVTVHPDPQTTGASTGKEEEHGKNQDITMSDKPNQTPEPEVTVHPDPQTTGASTGKEEEHGKNPKSTKHTVKSDLPTQKVSFHLDSSLQNEELLSRMRAVIYGNCIGDAIGLLTEFMTKEEAQEIYGTFKEKSFFGLRESKKHTPIDKLELEYYMKCEDFHRSRWRNGDWTDDSDQMILILRTLLENNGKADILAFVQKFKVWTETGYKELGDFGGMGIGATTFKVICKKDFLTDPHKCAYQVWDESGRWAAPNGGVMRTSILGIQDFSDIPTVIHNTKQICKVTHADPRCIASCVAVTTAIALMLQGEHYKETGYDEKKICEEAYKYACKELGTDEEKKELRRHMFANKLSELELSGDNKIGYTYKCLGAGFWAYRQKDFRQALTELVMEAGDADTNGAVAGALLGCKLGVEHLPETWLNGLVYKKWLDKQMDRYFAMLGLE